MNTKKLQNTNWERLCTTNNRWEEPKKHNILSSLHSNKFQNKILSFNDASNFCTNLGGKIFEPRNNFTDDQVYKSAKQNMNLNHGAWIGVISNHTVHWTGKKIFHGVWL